MATLPPVYAADGTDVVVVDEGAGRPIIVLHGGSSDESAWAAVAATLTSTCRVLRLRRRVYRLDLPSDPTTTYAEQVGDVLAVAYAVGERCVVVGHSSGAILALETVVRNPAPFSAVVVYEPPLVIDGPVGGPSAPGRARAAADAGDLGEAMAIFLENMVGIPHDAAYGVKSLVAQNPAYAALVPRQLDDNEAINLLGRRLSAYATIDLPVLLLTGDQSPAHLQQRSATLAEVLVDAHRVTLAGQSHGAHDADPAAVAGAIAEFIEELP